MTQFLQQVRDAQRVRCMSSTLHMSHDERACLSRVVHVAEAASFVAHDAMVSLARDWSRDELLSAVNQLQETIHEILRQTEPATQIFRSAPDRVCRTYLNIALTHESASILMAAIQIAIATAIPQPVVVPPYGQPSQREAAAETPIRPIMHLSDQNPRRLNIE